MGEETQGWPEWITCPVCGHRGKGEIARESNPIDLVMVQPEGHEEEGVEYRIPIARWSHCTRCGYLMFFITTETDDGAEPKE